MKAILPILMIVAPTVAQAQAAPIGPQPTMNMPNYSTERSTLDSYVMQRVVDTPTMERQKLARAIALRDEANRLRVADGGTLGTANLRYIQRKADAITGRREATGRFTR